MIKTKRSLFRNRMLKYSLQVGSLIALLAPITLVLYANRDLYFKTEVTAFKAGMPALLGICLIGVIALKEIKLGGLLWLGALYGILELFKNIIQELRLIVLVVIISFAVYKYIFKPSIVYMKKKCDMLMNALINASAMSEVYKNDKEDLDGSV